MIHRFHVLQAMKAWKHRALFRLSPHAGVHGLLLVILLSALLWENGQTVSAHAVSVALPQAVSNDWPMYLHDIAHTSASTDTTFSTANANQLKPLWTYQTGGGISSQPAIVNGVVYIGSWDGYEYAFDATTGAIKWKTFLGQTIAPDCVPATIGINSSAAVQNGIVYVGGGDRYWYALDAVSGAILWKVDTGDNSATGGHYNWSSPLIYNGNAYIGVASNCDRPLVQGQLLKVDLTTHQISQTLNLVNTGEVGAGVWTTPLIDPATNTIFMDTGTISLTTQLYAQSLVAINATTLQIQDYWQIPPDQAGIDLDWGNSPLFFTDIHGNQLVGAANKDGIFYAFNPANLAAGPVWQTVVAETGDCPPCGNGTVSTGAYGGGRIYMAGGNTVIGGQGYPGSIRALDPSTGKILWEQGTPNPIIPAVTYSNGLIIDEAGPNFEVRDASTGQRLSTYYSANGFYGAASVGDGLLVDGALNGTVYAFTPAPIPAPPPVDANCPSGWSCQDIGNPTPAGSETSTGTTWNISAAGTGLQGTADHYRSITRTVVGDQQIAIQVLAQPQTANAQVGISIRQSTDPASSYYGAFVTPNNGLAIQYRAGYGGNTTLLKQLTGLQLPIYLALQRKGDSLQAATSTDGINYTLVPGSTVTQVFPATTVTGVAVSSGANGITGTALLTPPTIGPLSAVAVPGSASPCPAGWSCTDIGNPTLVGDQTVTNGVWTLKASGNEIANYADHFHAVFQTVTGDTTLSAQITAQDNTSPGARAGLMLRQSTNPGSPYYGVFVTPQKGIVVQYRDTLGLNTINLGSAAGNTPIYLRIARWQSIFTAYTSGDGATWTPIDDSTITLNLPATLQVGLAMTSAAGGIGSSTMQAVILTNTAIVPPVLCPTGWSCGDVANSVPTGSEALANGTWTIRAGGSDIWGLYDQFHFDWQAIPADGSLSAHIVSLQNTDPWAKVGLMLRQNANASSPYYGVFQSAGNGIVVQYRLTTFGPSSQMLIPATNPAFTYLKVARAGAVFTAYGSADGTIWTPIAGSSLRLSWTGPLLAGIAVTSHSTAIRTTAVLDNVVVTTSAAPPPSNCPDTWNCLDIGNPLLIGNQTLNGGNWTVSGGGTDIWGGTDQFHYVWQTLNGDGTIGAHVNTLTNTDPWAKAGVMLRQSTDQGSAYYAAFASHDNGLIVQYRTALGGNTVQLTFPGLTTPNYLQVARSGLVFTAYTSSDGTTWTPLAQSSIRMVNLTGPLLAGLAVTSHNVSLINNATFDTVSVTTTAPQPPVPPCPTTWSCSDIGNPSIIGNQTLTNGAWTINTGGQDIWNGADTFHFIWQTLTADGTVSAHITSQSNTDPWAKAGVMFRTSTDVGSTYYGVFVTPGNGIAVQYRSTQGGATTQVQIAGLVPVYLQIARSGNVFTAYTSTDGTGWTPIPNSSVRLNMTGTLLTGLAATSHNDGYLATIVLDTVTQSPVAPPPPAPACPTNWSCADIGTPTLPGSQTLTNGTWTIQGDGADLWGTSDEFHAIWQTLTIDGGISAHITAQGNTDPWARAGVMLRQSTAVDSPYYGIFITPGNGISVQYRSTVGGTTTTLAIPGGVGIYLKVDHTGTTYTAYTSQNGTTWIPIAGSQVMLSLNGSLLAGLAVNSHNENSLSSATFDTVTIG
ncbi:outer membrane protein assembly factor BamB family protein [Tengunoibacter tsumagoiensis]|uniref:Pyrrolo-quinoline quinone repeat domain-containing protein n=1 Tax=Tengunoibacter tsumagoiensis TaxID=2014871 RepID=A0A402A7E8_9CHLR|nr:PQQ-binding-like beta-propeller repeat protein [Tengunoibacter tsumagoiensis]GCE14975.1 hypothetical protein KTT_48340 [Tengunoibacter tsumagoiensis]